MLNSLNAPMPLPPLPTSVSSKSMLFCSLTLGDLVVRIDAHFVVHRADDVLREDPDVIVALSLAGRRSA